MGLRFCCAYYSSSDPWHVIGVHVAKNQSMPVWQNNYRATSHSMMRMGQGCEDESAGQPDYMNVCYGVLDGGLGISTHRVFICNVERMIVDPQPMTTVRY